MRPRQSSPNCAAAKSAGKHIKKKLELGVQTLNPVAYKSQLDKRVVPILQTATGDLTAGFSGSHERNMSPRSGY